MIMTLMPRWPKLKQQTGILLNYTFIIFLSGFFIFPDDHAHRNFFYLFVLLPFLFLLDRSVIKSCFKSKIFIFSLAFLAYFGLSILWTQDVNIDIKEIKVNAANYYDLTRYFLLLVGFIILTIYLSQKNKNLFNQGIFWISICAALGALVSIMEFYDSHAFPDDRLMHGFNYYLDLPIKASTGFGFLGICAIYTGIHEKIFWKKIYYSFITIVFLSFILLSQARGPLAAFIAALSTGMILEKRWKLLGLISLLIIGWLVVAFSLDSKLFDHLFSFAVPYRFEIWKVTLDRIAQAPWFGKGYLTDLDLYIEAGRMQHPHNIFLIILLQSGMTGLLLFVALLATSFITALRYFLSSGNWVYISLLLMTILATSTNEMWLLYKPLLCWVFFWFPVATLAAMEIMQIKNK